LNYVKKLSKKTSLKMGLNVDLFGVDFQDRGKSISIGLSEPPTIGFSDWRKRWDAKE